MPQPHPSEAPQHHLAAAMAAAAMAMARAAAMNPASAGELLLNPAAMALGAANLAAARSSPISDPGSPPQSPSVINLTKATTDDIQKEADEDINVDDNDDDADIKNGVEA